MRLTVASWFVSGAALVVMSWLAASGWLRTYALSSVIAGVGGAFVVGGELFAVLGGPVHGRAWVPTLIGATACGLLCVGVTHAATARLTIIHQRRPQVSHP